jgi:uncharacterized protein
MSSGIFTLITGASEGLGKALALECASRKLNLILVALPGKELFQLAGALERNFQIRVAVFEKDLTIEEDCRSLYQEIVEQKWGINMLINNAGLGNCCAFEDGQLAGFQQLIKLNIMATTILTRLFIDLLKKQQKSYILNVSSLIAFFNLPNKQVYGGTKSYIYYFSKCLRNELAHLNISVSVLCPGGMNTNPRLYQLMSSGNWFVRNSTMSPESVAAIAITGLLNGQSVLIPGKLNRLSLVINKLLPQKLHKYCTRLLTNKVTSPSIIQSINQYEAQIKFPASA